jgi:hypothetical protein
MALETAINFIARLRGPRPNDLRDKLVYSALERYRSEL